MFSQSSQVPESKLPTHGIGLPEETIGANPERSQRERVLAHVQEMGFDIHGLDEGIIEQLIGNRLG